MGKFNKNILDSDGAMKLNKIKSFDLHNMRSISGSNYVMIERLLGKKFYGKYLHGYDKYKINESDAFIDNQYSLNLITADNDNKGIFANGNKISYNMIDSFMINETVVDREYIYEVKPNLSKWFNEVYIPVYIDKHRKVTDTDVYKNMYKGLLNMDIEVRYLERSNIEKFADWNFDSYVLLSRFNHVGNELSGEANTRYWDNNETLDENYYPTNVRRYAFVGYNRYNNSNSKLKNPQNEGGIELTDNYWGNSIDGANKNTGKRSKFSRHRNSTGNHVYRSKLTFMNTNDDTLRAASVFGTKLKRLYPEGGGHYNSKDYYMYNENYDFLLNEFHSVVQELNLNHLDLTFVTHLDMYQGINKGMIEPIISSEGMDYDFGTNYSRFTSPNLRYVSTYLQNYPTVNISFIANQKEKLSETRGLRSDNDLALIGYIKISCLNFPELGLGSYADDPYKEKRTCDDFSEHERFVVKIKVAKNDINLLYKNQNTRGDSIYLGASFIYQNERIRPNPPYCESYESVVRGDSRFLRAGAEFTNILNTHYSILDKSKLFLQNGAIKYGYDSEKSVKLAKRFMKLYNVHDTLTPNVSTNEYPFGGFHDIYNIANLGGWLLPPFRFGSMLSAKQGMLYANFEWRENQENYRINRQYYNLKKEPCISSSYSHLCAREYVELNPILNNRVIHM